MCGLILSIEIRATLSRFQSQSRFTAVTGRAVSKVAASAELQGKNLRTIHSSARPVFCRRTKWRIVGGSGLDLVFSPQVVGEAGQRFNLARLRLCLRVKAQEIIHCCLPIAPQTGKKPRIPPLRAVIAYRDA